MLKDIRYCSGWTTAGIIRIVTVIASVCIIFAPTCDTLAQTRTAYRWYFGQRAGISFDQGFPTAIADGQLNTAEGCATWSDPLTGELLFYTDGVSVWNRLHEVMPNGTGLFGDASTSQSAMIIPAPGRPNIYYIFNPAAVTSVNLGTRCLCLYYSVVDLRAGDGFGDVVKKNELVFNDITEHLTATQACDGESWWIVVRSRSSRHFYSFRLNRDQLVPVPVKSDAANPQLSVRDAGQMHISPNGRRMVVTSASGNSQLYDFDAQSGRVTNGISLFGDDGFGSHYGAAFSSDSRKVYVSVANETSSLPTNIYQFDCETSSATTTIASKFLVGSLVGIFSWVPMQLAPDGRIYVARPGTPWMASIRQPSQAGLGSQFADTSLRLTGVNRFGLPNIIGSNLAAPGTHLTGCSKPRAGIQHPDPMCAEMCRSFVDASSGSIDSWTWTFTGGNPTTTSERNPSRICYSAPGVFDVRLITANTFGADTAYTTIEIKEKPHLEVLPVKEVCPGDTFTLSVSGADSYAWSPANALDNPTSAKPIGRIRSTTIFTVVGYNSNGCNDTTSVLVRALDIKAGPDVTICSGGSAVLQAGGADIYLWFPSIGLDNPASATPRASPKVSTDYFVTMKRGSCIVYDTVRVTVVDSLTVSVEGPREACQGDTIVLNCVGATGCSWNGPGVLDASSPSTRVVVGTNKSVISVTVSSGNCSSTDSVTIMSIAPPTLDLGATVRVCNGESVILSALSDAETIEWFPLDGLDIATGPVVRCTPQRTSLYIVTARNASGCSRLDSILVEVFPRPNIDAGPDLSVCANGEIQLLASGLADRYAWLPSAGLDDPTSLAPSARPAQTTTYVLRALTGQCEAIDSVTVFVSELSVSVSPGVEICRGQGTQLVASGADRYEWLPAEGLSNAFIANPIANPVSTTTYSVRGYDSIGCEQTASVTVTVIDVLPIRLIAGSTTARAGEGGVGLAVYVEVPTSRLPLHIDTLRATLVHDASVYVPDSIDRGDLRTSVRGAERLIHLLVDNVTIISPRQKITEVRGTVLAGRGNFVSLQWEDVSWSGSICPTISSTGGILFVSGCNLLARSFRTFFAASINVVARQAENVVDIDLQATEPGSYNLKLVSFDGRILWESTVLKQSTTIGNEALQIDMSAVGSGAYVILVTMPTSSEAIPLLWVR